MNTKQFGSNMASSTQHRYKKRHKNWIKEGTDVVAICQQGLENISVCCSYLERVKRDKNAASF